MAAPIRPTAHYPPASIDVDYDFEVTYKGSLTVLTEVFRHAGSLSVRANLSAESRGPAELVLRIDSSRGTPLAQALDLLQQIHNFATEKGVASTLEG